MSTIRGKLICAGELTMMEADKPVSVTGVLIETTRSELQGLEGNMIYREVSVSAIPTPTAPNNVVAGDNAVPAGDGAGDWCAAAAKEIEADHKFGRMEPDRLRDRAAIIRRHAGAAGNVCDELKRLREKVGVRGDAESSPDDINHWSRLMDRSDRLTAAIAAEAAALGKLDACEQHVKILQWVRDESGSQLAAARERCGGLEAIIKDALPALREFASKNPKYYWPAYETKQDPCGVHAVLEAIAKAALAAGCPKEGV